MTLKLIFSLALLFVLQSSCMQLIISDEYNQQECAIKNMIPQEIFPLIIHSFDCPTMRNWKLTCQAFNCNSNYSDISYSIIINDTSDLSKNQHIPALIFDGLIHFAHTEQQKNFQKLMKNNFLYIAKKIKPLGWSRLLATDALSALKGELTKIKPSDWQEVFDNELTTKIILSSINPNIRDNLEETPLTWVCKHNILEQNQEQLEHILIKLLNNENININIQNNDGNTPLHLAIIKDNKNMATLLLANEKTNQNIHNNDKLTPFDIAYKSNNIEMIRLLHTDKRMNPTTTTEAKEILSFIDQDKQDDDAALVSKTLSTNITFKAKKPTQSNDALHNHILYRYLPLGVLVISVLITYLHYNK